MATSIQKGSSSPSSSYDLRTLKILAKPGTMMFLEGPISLFYRGRALIKTMNLTNAQWGDLEASLQSADLPYEIFALEVMPTETRTPVCRSCRLFAEGIEGSCMAWVLDLEDEFRGDWERCPDPNKPPFKKDHGTLHKVVDL